MPATKIPPATKFINNVCVSASDVQIEPSRNLWFRLFNPNTNSGTPLPLIVYFHGGGFTHLGPDTWTYDYICSLLAAKVPAVIASVNYRLAPDHKYPTQYDDGYDALKFLDAQNAAVLPAYTDLSNCFIGGDSPGANIAHHVTVRAVRNADVFDRIRIAGLLSLQPFFGGEERTESETRLPRHPIVNVDESDLRWKWFLPECADRNHPAVNVSGGRSEELKSIEFPPTLVIVGGKDPLLDWQKRYAEWLRICGKEVKVIMYPNAEHGFYTILNIPEFALLLKRMKFFIKRLLHHN